MSCYSRGDFVKYWEENMNALGLWIPSTSYEAAGGITGMISVIAGIVETSPTITVAQAFYKAKISVGASRLAALYASYWVGAAIGSIAVSTGRSLSCGATIADALIVARNEFKIYGSWLESELMSHPELLQRNA
tara:strand:+ start:136 stop:537 length:402 start_codon:yes stop_codon:yes gene_type:complete